MADHIFVGKSLDNTVNSTKGKEIMDALILSQYKGKPNLEEFFGAFTSEMDYLFENIERVYLGRFLEYAEGTQLDILGDIVGQTRAVALFPQFFGFQGAAGVAGMADESSPAAGGIFMSEDIENFVVTPLDDITYRRAIRAKAFLNYSDTVSLEVAYTTISMLLTHIPRTMDLITVADRNIRLDVSATDINSTDASLITHFAQYFVPSTSIFNINLV